MTTPYDQHREAFRAVSAYVVLRNGQCVARVLFRHPKDGAGKTWCYLHLFGADMTRGSAGGGGYDKRTASCVGAALRVVPPTGPDCEEQRLRVTDLASAIKGDGPGGRVGDWSERLTDAGYAVIRAI
jgi:hypothetical protein